MRKKSNNSFLITCLVIAAIIAATIWYYSDARKETFDLYKEGKITALTKRAEKGDVTAQFYLGLWFGEQQKDGASALEWWQKASENGEAYVSHYIAESYLAGRYGVEKNIPLGRQWLQKALAQNYKHAATLLYLIDSNTGEGVYYDYIYDTQGEMAAQAVNDAAPKWLEEGILLGDESDLYSLSAAYSRQAYPVQRAAELIPAVQKAMEKSLQNDSGRSVKEHKESTYYQLLGILYFAEADYANAFNYLKKSANMPDKIYWLDSAAYRLGRIYEEGLGTDSDARKARETYATTRQNARRKDDRLAMWHLAMMQAQGRGGDVDKTSAEELLHKLESVSRDDVLSPAVLDYPSAEQMDALREAIAAP